MRCLSPLRSLAAVAALAVAGAAAAAELRTWTDSSGKFSVKAKFVAHDGANVSLEQEDGSKIEVELAKLSDADKKYVADQKRAADSPFKPKAADPFKKVLGANRSVAPGWAAVRAVPLTPTQDKWAFTPAAGREAAGTPRPVPLPHKADFFEKAQGLAVNAAGTRAAVGLVTSRPGVNRQSTTRVAVCDLEKGAVLGTTGVDGAWVVLATDDDGKRVVARSDGWGPENQGKAEVWSLAEATVTPDARIDLAGGKPAHDAGLKWAAYLPDGRLVTAQNNGRVAVWDAASQPQFQVQAFAGSVPALSPDRKFLAFLTNTDLAVLDLTAGTVAAAQGATNLFHGVLAFSPDGKRLACSATNKLHVWDFATGKQEREIMAAVPFAPGRAFWTDNGHVLVGDRVLIDVENQVPLWSYDGQEQAEPAAGVCWAAVFDGQDRPGALLPLRLPHEAAREKVAEAVKDPNFLVLKPGTTVAIDVSGLPAAEQDWVRDGLAGRLEGIGCKAGDGGTIRLVATTEQGKERDVNYHSFGRPGSRAYKVKEHFTKLQFVYQGKPAWEVRGGGVPFLAHLKEGETMETHLKKYETPNYGWYETVELPKRLLKPTGRPTLGASRVTVAGLR